MDLEEKKKIKKLEKKIYHFICDIGTLFISVPKVFIIAKEESYFPELSRKNFMIRLNENFIWLLKYREVNKFYNLYGMDIKDFRIKKQYNDYKSFIRQRNELNNFGMETIDCQITLLRDKHLFYKYMLVHNFPVPKVFAIIKENCLYDDFFNCIDEAVLINKEEYFVKDISGECASYIKHIKNYDDYVKTCSERKKGTYILQEKISQCSKMNQLYSGSINTLRIVTINKNGKPYLFSSLLRVGTSKTGNVDNWAAGGLAIGVNSDGSLKENGFHKPMYGRKISSHPDTGVVFKEFTIPFFKEAVNMALEAHKIFYNVVSIGWDIAITENGPCFIEGNDNWEISLMQACDRPLKVEWNDVVHS